MSQIKSHRDLIVWQKAMDLVVHIYRLTAHFPYSETHRLVAQITRSAASVPANLAEGHARGTRKEFANFVANAKGSLMETETFLMLAIRLGYLKRAEGEPALELVTEIGKMLTSIRGKLLRAG